MKCSCGQTVQDQRQLCPACGKIIELPGDARAGKAQQPRSYTKILITTLALTIVASLFGFIPEQNPPAKQLVHHFNPAATTTVLAQPASKISFGFPYQFQQEKVDIPPSMSSLISTMERYISSESSLDVDILYCLYNTKALPDNWSPDLEGAVNKILHELTSTPGVSNLRSNKQSLMISGKPALSSTTTFVDPNKVEFQSATLYIADGYSFWQINLLYSKSDEHTELAQQVLQSVALLTQ